MDCLKSVGNMAAWQAAHADFQPLSELLLELGTDCHPQSIPFLLRFLLKSKIISHPVTPRSWGCQRVRPRWRSVLHIRSGSTSPHILLPKRSRMQAGCGSGSRGGRPGIRPCARSASESAVRLSVRGSVSGRFVEAVRGSDFFGAMMYHKDGTH